MSDRENKMTTAYTVIYSEADKLTKCHNNVSIDLTNS